MRPCAPFRPGDLAALDERLFCAATRIVPMADIAAGDNAADVIGLRHDCDNVFPPALDLARWEAARGYRATYFILHGSPYWDAPGLRAGLEEIAGLGHEIGLHANGIAESLRTGADPHEILTNALGRLRGWGHEIRGTVAHGDLLCRDASGRVRVVNDEIFVECARPQFGEPDRTVDGLKLAPVPLADFGLDYDANWLPRGEYLSDSGGRWSRPFGEVAGGFPFSGQLHMLVHPDWWAGAFVAEEIAA